MSVSKKMRSEWQWAPCLVCGVDSKPVLTFFIWLIGAGVLGSFCVLVWGYLSGKFSTEEASSMIPLNVEEISHE